MREGSNKSCLEVNPNHAEIMKVSNGLQTGHGKRKPEEEKAHGSSPQQTLNYVLQWRKWHVCILLYYCFHNPFTIPLNYTFIGPELFFSCSTRFKNNKTFQPSDGNDAWSCLHYYKAQLREVIPL